MSILVALRNESKEISMTRSQTSSRKVSEMVLTLASHRSLSIYIYVYMYVLLTTWGHVAKLNLDFFYKTQANGDSSFMYCKLKHISVTKDKEQLDSRKVIT